MKKMSAMENLNIFFNFFHQTVLTYMDKIRHTAF